MLRKTPQDALLFEFGCYYIADEFPWQGPFQTWARDSAERLANLVEKEEVAALVSLLLEMAGNRRHPMVFALEQETHIDWSEDDRFWQVFADLVTLIAAALSSTRTS
ncbi:MULTISPECIES: hypothetical protein [unclassified Roseateles]|uniref:hypothetical protein n=1 Tax=Pelomonas sp. Root1237 TaxID=1736434 RepID=UPI000A9EB7C3|nr:hypothetical protein [Pelomonas sp. Root1237]